MIRAMRPTARPGGAGASEPILRQIQEHLAAQDSALDTLLDQVAELEAAVSRP